MFGTRAQAKEALTVANTALAKVNEHEARCTERWAEARDTWTRVERTLDELRNTTSVHTTAVALNQVSWRGPALSALAALVVLLIGALGTVVFHLLTRTPG